MKNIITVLAALAALTVIVCACTKTEAQTAPSAPDTTQVKHPDWSRNAVIYEVNLRQYTDSGTLSQFATHLPRLKELGVDILWFMPIHPISVKNRKGGLGSYYAVRDYKAVNPEFGTLDDFKAVVKQAHDLGMKVLIDWVPNHTGCDNVWVSEHPDWYARDDKGQMFGPFDWTDTYKLDYNNPEMRAAMIDAMKFWLTEAGIDGFRCDVAMEVPTDFWAEARPQLQAVQPGLFMLAEASKPELCQQGFDMCYNWPMKDLFSAIAATSGQYTFAKEGEQPRSFPHTTPLAIDSLLAEQAATYPVDSYLMQMTSNHDLNSWEGTEFERLGNLSDAFAVLSYTLPGMPVIYTGQEAGLARALEFFVKDKAPEWEPRNRYYSLYQTLNTLKHTHPALEAGATGGEVVRHPTSSADIYCFSRVKDGDTVVTLVNLGAAEAPVKFTDKAPDVSNMVEIFTGQEAAIPATLAPGAYAVYIPR